MLQAPPLAGRGVTHLGLGALQARKQNTYPVFYLTEAGEDTSTDPRRNSIREAIRFAKESVRLVVMDDCFARRCLRAHMLCDVSRGVGSGSVWHRV